MRRRARPRGAPGGLSNGSSHQRLVADREQVERDVPRRRRLGEHPHPGVGRVDPLLQLLELEPVADRRTNDLAVEDAALGQCLPGRPRRPRGSSGSAAWCCGWPARPRRRRGTRCSGSRPTSARTSSPPCLAGSGIPLTDLASIGWTGGMTGRSHVPHRSASASMQRADVPILLRAQPLASPGTGCSASWCRRRASRRSASTPTAPTRPSRRRPRRSTACGTSPAPSETPATKRLFGRAEAPSRARRGLPRRRLRRRQDPPARVAVARGARAQAVRHLRRAHPPRRRARLPRRRDRAVGVHAGLRRRVRARRPGRHRAGLDAARPGCARPACGWPRRPTRCPASSARAGSRPPTSCARSRGWPRHFELGAHRRRGLPAPRAARGAARRVPTTRCRRAAARAGRELRPLRRPAPAPRHRAPLQVRRPARRRLGGLPRGRPHRRRPGRRAAAGRPRRPDVRPRPAGASPAASPSTGCSPRRCSRAATARSTSGPSAVSSPSPVRVQSL